MEINGKMGRWIQSFLSQRQQRVVVNKRMLTISKLKAGVPQGSVLGLVLILVYFYDIGKDLTVCTLVYVDDTKVTKDDIEYMHSELKKLDYFPHDPGSCITRESIFLTVQY